MIEKRRIKRTMIEKRRIKKRTIEKRRIKNRMNEKRRIKNIMIEKRRIKNIMIEKRRIKNSFSFNFSSRWHRSARKGPYALRPVSQQSPQGCPRNSANICLVEHRSFSALEGGMSAASFLHSSFLQAVNAVMLWLVRAEKVPQAQE